MFYNYWLILLTFYSVGPRFNSFNIGAASLATLASCIACIISACCCWAAALCSLKAATCLSDLIILAGYLKIIPKEIISIYKHKILNIHPSLLPKYGGKGFYGIKVHEQVINAKEKHSGATVHFVDEIYDNGPIIAQHRVHVSNDETAESLSRKVLEIEHKLFPYVVKKICENKVKFIKGKPLIQEY